MNRLEQLFRCYDARLHTLPGAPSLRGATHEQRVEHSDLLEALNADKIVPRFGPDPDPPYVDPDHPDFKDEFFVSGCHEMLEQEEFLETDEPHLVVDRRAPGLDIASQLGCGNSA
jgi:hypothetical protein